MHPPIRLIALDLDGTLLTSRHTVSPRNAAAIAAARERGVRVVLATGKTPASDQAVLAPLGLDGPGVYAQGLIVGDRYGDLIYQRTLPHTVAARVIALAERDDLSLVAYCGRELYCAERNRYTDHMIHYHEPTPQAVGSLRTLFGRVAINKLLFVGEIEQIPPLRARLAEELAGTAELVQGHASMVEVLPPGASKGDGLARLLEYLDVPPSEVMAIGDGENDIEMIALAGLGIAMGNAIPGLKAIADAVVATHDDDGVAEAIERFVLDA